MAWPVPVTWSRRVRSRSGSGILRSFLAWSISSVMSRSRASHAASISAAASAILTCANGSSADRWPT